MWMFCKAKGLYFLTGKEAIMMMAVLVKCFFGLLNSKCYIRTQSFII